MKYVENHRNPGFCDVFIIYITLKILSAKIYKFFYWLAMVVHILRLLYNAPFWNTKSTSEDYFEKRKLFIESLIDTEDYFEKRKLFIENLIDIGIKFWIPKKW